MKRSLYLILPALMSGCASMHEGHDGCAEYRRAVAGKPVEEQRKLAEAHISRMHGSADAAHIERHMRMMEQRCRGGGPT